MRRDESLDGQVWVITGGASGIGAQLGKRVIELGGSVAIADIDEASAAKLFKELMSDRMMYLKTDVSSEPSVIKFVNQVAARYSRINVLVNSAAVFIYQGLEADVQDWMKAFNTNVLGTVLMCKHCLPHMPANEGCSIINISSISGIAAMPKSLPYTATKGAIISLSRAMALDLSEQGIRVNCVTPGMVWTDNNAARLNGSLGLDRTSANAHPYVGGAHILGRVADPSEIVEPILFLASKGASFVTGSNLLVDGGYTAL